MIIERLLGQGATCGAVSSQPLLLFSKTFNSGCSICVLKLPEAFEAG